MNILLPLILLIIANLVLYWIFFGKAKFENQMHGSQDSNLDKVSGIFGSEPQIFNPDQLIKVKDSNEVKVKSSKSVSSVKKKKKKINKKSGKK